MNGDCDDDDGGSSDCDNDDNGGIYISNYQNTPRPVLLLLVLLFGRGPRIEDRGLRNEDSLRPTENQLLPMYMYSYEHLCLFIFLFVGAYLWSFSGHFLYTALLLSLV